MMKRLRRVTAIIANGFDWMVSQIENHEALIDSTIAEIQEVGSRAAAQLKRVKQDGATLRHRLEELRKNAELWTERALAVAALDEQRALECLKRKKRTQREISELEQRERSHSQIDKQLTADLDIIEERMEALRQQRKLLGSRQSRAEALRSFQEGERRLFGEMDEILTRWKSKVTDYEMQAGYWNSPQDGLEEQFNTLEKEAELNLTLSKLREGVVR
ncbi:MAG: PspA/IM30 family protein [Oligoflexia bacterium]|nr:PspA/IM30 family protein [Oligoflexia bacterium]